jgi:hypothetical protein
VAHNRRRDLARLTGAGPSGPLRNQAKLNRERYSPVPMSDSLNSSPLSRQLVRRMDEQLPGCALRIAPSSRRSSARRVRRRFDAAKAARLRQAIRRVTGAFARVRLREDDYANSLKSSAPSSLSSSASRTNRRSMETTRLAQDIPAVWARDSADRRRRIVRPTVRNHPVTRGKIFNV